MPWHTVLCEHEIYIHETIKRLPVSDEERLRLVFAFSASRYVPLFDAVLLPFHRELLDDPANATRRDGELHQVLPVANGPVPACLHGSARIPACWQHLRAWRETGGKLHTTAHSCHPPKGPDMHIGQPCAQ